MTRYPEVMHMPGAVPPGESHYRKVPKRHICGLRCGGRAGNPHRAVLRALFTAAVIQREPGRNGSHVFARAAMLSFCFSPTATLCFRICSSPEKPEAEEQGLQGVCQFMLHGAASSWFKAHDLRHNFAVWQGDGLIGRQQPLLARAF